MKKYDEGGAIKSNKVDYGRDVVEFVLRNQSPASSSRNIKDLKLADVPGMAKEVVTTAAGTAALPFAEIASAAVNAGRGLKDKVKSRMGKPSSFRQNSASDDESDSATKMAKGGSVSSASKRADGCAVKGKTKGRMV
jgi:hypothetical protein